MTYEKDARTLAPLIAVARAAIEAAIRRQAYTPPREGVCGEPSNGVFVTLMKPHHELRGCIGHIQPVHATIAEEVADCAVLAAMEDPRFPPLSAAELPGIHIEISVLHPLEPVSDLKTLDSNVYGVLVRSGSRSGLLLPAIEGVDTVEEQLAIAMQKGGIRSLDDAAVYRFRVTKVSEEQPAAAR